MNVETLPQCDVSSRPTRAGIAQMTLQLRALLRDATAEEERAAIVDVDAAREKLRARLGPLVDERRRGLDDSLAAARADAAAAIAAARAEASSMSINPTQAVIEVPVVEVPVLDVPVVEPDRVPTFHIVIDPDAFAQAFAAAFTELFDGQSTSMVRAVPTWLSQPAPPEQTTTKPSFWTHARHPDVLLMGLSMVIVLVVLAAWFA